MYAKKSTSGPWLKYNLQSSRILALVAHDGHDSVGWLCGAVFLFLLGLFFERQSRRLQLNSADIAVLMGSISKEDVQQAVDLLVGRGLLARDGDTIVLTAAEANQPIFQTGNSSSIDERAEDDPVNGAEESDVSDVYADYKSRYNYICDMLPPVERITDGRKKMIDSYLESGGDIEQWQQICQKVKESDFLTGKAKSCDQKYKNFKVGFEWLLAHAEDIASGKYDNFAKKETSTDLDTDAYEPYPPAVV